MDVQRIETEERRGSWIAQWDLHSWRAAVQEESKSSNDKTSRQNDSDHKDQKPHDAQEANREGQRQPRDHADGAYQFARKPQHL